MISRLRFARRAALFVGLTLCSAVEAFAADPVPNMQLKVFAPVVWTSQVVSDVVLDIETKAGTGKYILVEALAAPGTMAGYEDDAVRGLSPGSPLPAGVTEITMTDGQLMHVYVKSSGPLQHQPLAQWGTIIGSLAFVVCMFQRVFFKRA